MLRALLSWALDLPSHTFRTPPSIKDSVLKGLWILTRSCHASPLFPAHLTLATSQSPASVRLHQPSCHLLKIQTPLICHHHVGGGDAMALCQHPFWAVVTGFSSGRTPRVYFLAVQFHYGPYHKTAPLIAWTLKSIASVNPSEMDNNPLTTGP